MRDPAFAQALWKEIERYRAFEPILTASSDQFLIEKVSENALRTLKRSREVEVGSDPQPGKRARAQGPAAICINCAMPFVVGEKSICQYHDGNLETDRDNGNWDDHEEDKWGDIDSDDSKVSYAEFYEWDCCKQAGDYVGCRIGQAHQYGRSGDRTDYADLMLLGLKPEFDDGVLRMVPSAKSEQDDEASDKVDTHDHSSGDNRTTTKKSCRRPSSGVLVLPVQQHFLRISI